MVSRHEIVGETVTGIELGDALQGRDRVWASVSLGSASPAKLREGLDNTANLGGMVLTYCVVTTVVSSPAAVLESIVVSEPLVCAAAPDPAARPRCSRAGITTYAPLRASACSPPSLSAGWCGMVDVATWA